MRKVFFFIAIWFFSLVATAAPQKIEIVDLVRNGDIEGVRAALDAGTDVNAKSPDGATALQWAVHGDQELMVELLLEVGCLLYTSPSPRDLSTSRMPSSA